MRTCRVAVAIAGTLACLLPAAAHAQDAPPPAAAQAAQAPGAAGHPELVRWWEKSSLAIEPMPEKLLFHLAADFSFTDSRGNTSGTQLTKRAELILRKRRVTNRLTTDIRDTNMVYGLGGGATDYHQSTTRNHTEFDVTKRVIAVGGVEYAVNTLYFLDHRLTFYTGLGATVVESKQHKVAVIGGVGYALFQFMGEEMAAIDPVAVAGLPTLSPNTAGGLVMQAWTWTPSPRVSVTQSASALEFVNDDLGHLITFDVTVNVPVAKHLSFVPRYTVKDESNIYVKALGVKTVDRTFGVGIRLNF